MFGDIVREHRQRLGLTQEDLADRSGVTVRTIGKIESGRIAAPRLTTARLLAEALGLDGANRDRFYAAAREPVAVPAERALAPAQLPPDVVAFTGRGAELEELDRLLATVGEGWTAVVISAVSGTAGVGKTALAVHWAHRVVDRFPDGQLYIDLRAYDPERLVTPGEALAAFLRALGVDGPKIPYDVAERAALYRTLIAHRRMLVILDNAGSAEHVRPLLPASQSSMIVVTSRDRLAGLVARHGARRVDLDLLPTDDAVHLLRTLIGDRVDAEPEAAAALADQCARLPLALRVGAEIAVARSATPLAQLVAELSDEQRRLDLMDAGGDEHTAVRAVFSRSYQRLEPGVARVFRLLGLSPAADIDRHGAAALAGIDVDQAHEALEVLGRAHLLHSTGTGRYGRHDLLRAYAAGLAEAEDAEADRRAALTRLFDFYLSTTVAAVELLNPASVRLDEVVAGTPLPAMTDSTAALAWLDVERPNLVAACGYTATHGWPSHTARLAVILYRYLDLGGHHLDALTVHGHARSAAERSGDGDGEAEALVNLGAVHWAQARYDEAERHLERAVEIYRKLDNPSGEARALGNLGGVYEQQGFYAQALVRHGRALRLYEQVGNLSGQTYAHGNLSMIHHRQGRYAEAIDHAEQSRRLAEAAEDRYGQCLAWGNLGITYGRQGRYAEAVDALQQALALAHESGDRTSQAYVLTNLGVIDGRQGRYGSATAFHEAALVAFREVGDRSGEAEALNGLGEVSCSAGRVDEGRIHHDAALALAIETDNRYEQARSHTGLGRACQLAGRSEDARHHWQQALMLYTDLGSIEAEDISGHLAVLGPSTA